MTEQSAPSFMISDKCLDKEGFDHIPKEWRRRRPGSKRPNIPLGGRSEGE
jgi:hypothetical protein